VTAAHIDLLDVTSLRAAAELRVVRAMDRAALLEVLAQLAHKVADCGLDREEEAEQARRLAAELVDEITLDERIVALATEVLEAAEVVGKAIDEHVENTAFMFEVEFAPPDEDDAHDGPPCIDCGEKIDLFHGAYCDSCAHTDDDGEVFHYREHFKKRPAPESLRPVSVASNGTTGAMMLVGSLAEVQAAAKLYGDHVRLVAVEPAGAPVAEAAP
jgi:hypothetical protein